MPHHGIYLFMLRIPSFSPNAVRCRKETAFMSPTDVDNGRIEPSRMRNGAECYIDCG